MTTAGYDTRTSRITDVTRRYWGFDALRPLQAEAIAAGLENRDSLLVMPTGSGKSLCYQVPPILAQRTDVVVSPLIALMKDQVDNLRQCGYPAASLHSGMSSSEIQASFKGIAAGKFRLIFVAPERLLTTQCLGMLQQADVRAFAIDEAHCISHWGHDFRPEYRRLAEIRQSFPNASFHAFTATATKRVREDIVHQLRLKDPAVLVGDFDRPNLTYRVFPRLDVYAQTLEVIRRHANEAVIVYCVSRRDTESMSAHLAGAGVKVTHYHAGMDPADRRRAQDSFADERIDVVVATVAFGMGIDRSNVRCVIHAALPKSIEHYQQETGRAGRDGLPAECVLFYSASDVIRWEELIARSAGEASRPDEVSSAMKAQLDLVQRYAASMQCRHRRLVEHFGQPYARENCEACDVCLGETEEVADSTVLAQKILSCIARVDQRFGAKHVTEVLVGADTELIRSLGHDKLSTYGLLRGTDRKALGNLVYQLVDAGVLVRTAGDRPILKLNEASWEVLRGWRTVRLFKPKETGVRKTRHDEDAWSGVDAELFEELRKLRLDLAARRHVPAYTICGDTVLRDMARARPGSAQALKRIRGLGERKIAEYGGDFLSCIRAHCEKAGVPLDQSNDGDVSPPRSGAPGMAKLKAFELFGGGAAISEVAAVIGRAVSTTTQYLAEYIERDRPESVEPWVNSAEYREIASVISVLGPWPLRPIFERLGEKYPYDTIRIVSAHIAYVGIPSR